jgi:hypothetical protein
MALFAGPVHAGFQFSLSQFSPRCGAISAGIARVDFNSDGRAEVKIHFAGVSLRV